MSQRGGMLMVCEGGGGCTTVCRQVPVGCPVLKGGPRGGGHEVAHVLITVVGINVSWPPRWWGPRPGPTRPAMPAGPAFR